MENYEERYKESLEKAKEFFNSPRTCFDINHLTEIFPELREFEDERIRKEIIEFLKSQGASKRWDFNTWIAWLEKQGEKSSWSAEDEQMVEDIIEAIDTQYAVSDYNEMVSWLKSIKSNHWKPSEEQMKEALQTEYEKGRFDMREEMMKDAVEGTVKYRIGSAEIPQCDRRYQVLSDQTPIANAKLGDKVKIIICKTEQQ